MNQTSTRKTGKALGFKKGDFVFTGLFPGVIISDVHTTTPCCEVWGLEQEMGSVYSDDLRHISYPVFREMCKAQGHDPIIPQAAVSQDAIAKAEQGGVL